MSRTKIIAALFAVAAISGLYAALASANWMAGGKDVPAENLPISLVATVHEAPILNLPTIGVKIECTGLDIEEGFIIGGTNLNKAGHLKFLGCKTILPATKCILEGQPNATIETAAILSKAIKFGTLGARILFSPETGNLFATPEFSGENTCALAGAQPVKGRVTVAAPLAQDELLLQPIEGLGSTENSSLEIGKGTPAFIEKGKILLRLANDSKWSLL